MEAACTCCPVSCAGPARACATALCAPVVLRVAFAARAVAADARRLLDGAPQLLVGGGPGPVPCDAYRGVALVLVVFLSLWLYLLYGRAPSSAVRRGIGIRFLFGCGRRACPLPDRCSGTRPRNRGRGRRGRVHVDSPLVSAGRLRHAQQLTAVVGHAARRRLVPDHSAVAPHRLPVSHGARHVGRAAAAAHARGGGAGASGRAAARVSPPQRGRAQVRRRRLRHHVQLDVEVHGRRASRPQTPRGQSQVGGKRGSAPRSAPSFQPLLETTLRFHRTTPGAQTAVGAAQKESTDLATPPACGLGPLARPRFLLERYRCHAPRCSGSVAFGAAGGEGQPCASPLLRWSPAAATDGACAAETLQGRSAADVGARCGPGSPALGAVRSVAHAAGSEHIGADKLRPLTSVAAPRRPHSGKIGTPYPSLRPRPRSVHKQLGSFVVGQEVGVMLRPAAHMRRLTLSRRHRT